VNDIHFLGCSEARIGGAPDIPSRPTLAPLGAAGQHELARHAVLDEGEKIVITFVLVMMGIDVRDQDAVELALVRLFARARAAGWC